MKEIKALLVEDDEGVASLYLEILARGEIQVDHVLTTREGLEKLAQAPYDLVFTDLSQNPTGVEVYRDAVARGIKDVYITTGGGKESLLEEARQIAGQRLLERPFPISKIFAVAEQAKQRKLETPKP